MKANFAIAMERGSKGYKIFMALPVLDLSWGFYRLSISINNNRFSQTVLASILLFLVIPFMWLVDIISIAKTGHILWFKDRFEDAIPMFNPEERMMQEVLLFQENQKKRMDKEEAKRVKRAEKKKQKELQQQNKK